ncbi:MAG: SpoIIE family protein phosphatase [Candidatus Krumholzibacteriota bacterium]|nr:SpoIIE family protein phosphatase [Candidatus Krumholzibacteriota bacterium]
MKEANNNDALHLERENQRLKAAVEELSILNDISTAINSTSSLEEIIQLIVKKCIKYLKVEQGTVTLLDDTARDGPFRTMIRQADSSLDILPYHFDTQLTGWMLMHKKPLLINDLRHNEIFRSVRSENNPIETLLSVPLMLKGKIIGSLNIFNKLDRSGFQEADKRLLSIIATQSAQVIENARLYQEEQSLIHLREEMKVAYTIQTSLLPKESPSLEGYDVAGKSIPARTVGGDYFDFIKIDDHKTAVCLGDISGKGMPAALLMSNLQAILRGQCKMECSPSTIVQRSNRLLYESTEANRFATFFFGVLDSRNHEYCYCNAGHNLPFHFRDGRLLDRLDAEGLVLGALEDFSYEEKLVRLQGGDMIVIFSDGISEARNTREEEFGEDKLPQIVKDNRRADAAVLIDKIISSVQEFSRGLPQMDDMTVVAIKKK